jgi:hypothetical protein
MNYIYYKKYTVLALILLFVFVLQRPDSTFADTNTNNVPVSVGNNLPVAPGNTVPVVPGNTVPVAPGNIVPAAPGNTVLVAPTQSNTTGSGCTGSACLPNPIKAGSIQDLIYLIVSIATYIGVVIAILAFIYVGFKFVAAQGNPEKISEAKKMFLWIVIGVAILIGATAITDVVKNTLTKAGVVDSSFFTTTSH